MSWQASKRISCGSIATAVLTIGFSGAAVAAPAHTPEPKGKSIPIVELSGEYEQPDQAAEVVPAAQPTTDIREAGADRQEVAAQVEPVAVSPESSVEVVTRQAEPAVQSPEDATLVDGQSRTNSRRAGPLFENQVQARTAVKRQDPAELTYLGERKPPSRSSFMAFGYRHFAIQDGLDRRQDWHVLVVDITPMRRYVRLNFATEFGIEGGDAAARRDRGDLYIMEKLGLGIQWPGWVTPYLEFQGGAGVGRIELFDRNDLGIFLSTGLDAGAQWSVVPGINLIAAVGWLRPVIATAGQSLDAARAFQRGTFKVGVGF